MQKTNLEKEIKKYSEMATEERAFVLEMIQKHKPKKILSVGIAAGANEAMILDFLERENRLSETQFFSIDYSPTYYRNENKPSGFLVALCVPHLQKYWNLYTGGFAANHLDKVGTDIDFCIIDTVHTAPGEALDFLMVLPYLSQNAVVIMHDLTYHFFDGGTHEFSNICSVLFNAYNGKKSYPSPYFFTQKEAPKGLSVIFQNIGACVLSDNQMDKNNVESYFRVLNLPWYYMPNNEDLSVARAHFIKHYGEYFGEYFDKILEYQRKWVEKFYKMQRYEIYEAENIKLKKKLTYKLDRLFANSYKKMYNALRGKKIESKK